jgi:hypothetical protein
MIVKILTCGWAFAIAATTAHAQTPPPPAPSCATPEYRQFDYWVGEWDVFGANDQKIGTNKITRVSGTCALLEQWQATGGGAGSSINFFDAADKKWHQVWMGGDGVALYLSGNPVEGAMELGGGDRVTPRGTVRDRIRWTLLPDQSVEQLWSISTDAGATWTTGFRGIYRRTK